MTNTNTDERRQLAHHAAAHAMMWMMHGVPVKWLTMTESGQEHSSGVELDEWLARNGAEEPGDDEQVEIRLVRAATELMIMVQLAGPVAETLCTSNPSLPGSRDDIDTAVSMASELQADFVVGNYLNYLWARTGAHLLSPGIWAVVDALAEELMTHRRVEEDVIDRIYHGDNSARREVQAPGASDFKRSILSCCSEELALSTTGATSQRPGAGHQPLR